MVVEYNDIKDVLSDYLIDDHRHLFSFNDVNVMFWPKVGRTSWRIVTDLSVDELDNVNRNIQEHGKHFDIMGAWEDLSRPIFATPQMNSQLVGNIYSLETVNIIWTSILERNEPMREPIRLSGKTDQQKKIKIPKPPKGRSIDDMIKRTTFTENRDKEKKPKQRKLVRTKTKNRKNIDQLINSIFEDVEETTEEEIQTEDGIIKGKAATELYKKHKEEVDAYVNHLRSAGKSYRDISDESTSEFGFYISTYRVRQIINK